MKSTTCHKQTSATSLTSAALISSDASSQHRHHPSQYRNNSVSSRGSSIKLKPSDANNNANNSPMEISTAPTTTKMSVMTAPTRSKNSEKYSLRQRQKRSFAVPSSAATVSAISGRSRPTGPSTGTAAPSTGGRINSNTTVKRSNTSVTQPANGHTEKAKSKAAPLSKYRRKTANARERTRMREINTAFESLRRCVPHTITGDESTSSNEKLTKITTLRIAMKYIEILSQALDNPSFQADFLLECQNDGDLRFSTPNWVQPMEAAPPSEEDIQPVATATTPSRLKARKSKLQATKVSKRQRTKTKPQETFSPYLTSSSTFSSSISSSSSSAYASMSASPLFDDCHSMTDLSSMILESDGESLHLSEPCLSPMNRNFHLGMQSLDGTEGLIKNTPMTITIENPLELSLRLLEPDGDSLEFSTDQQPSTCISPLATLESFNPFGDLLHSEFSEHSSLDLFLT